MTRSRKVRGKSVRTIRRSLEAFCSDRGYGGGFGHVLMANGRSVSLRSLLVRPDRWFRFLLSLWRGPAALLKIGMPGAQIRVKNNIRIFYPPVGGPGAELLTAKVGLRSVFGSGSLGREVRARAFLRTAVPAMSVPRVLRYDRCGLRWLEEEYFSASADASEIDKARAFLDVWAERFYAASARPRELVRSLAWFGMTFDDVRVVCEETGVTLPDSTVRKIWPVALGHGDLSPGNMIRRKDGRLAVIDWERFGRAPVAWDLKKLSLFDPARSSSVLEALSPPRAIEPTRQMEIVLAMQVVRLRTHRDRYLLYWRHHVGLSRSESQSRQSAAEAQLTARLRTIRAEIETAVRAITTAPEASTRLVGG